jgi:hypothetical protein
MSILGCDFRGNVVSAGDDMVRGGAIASGDLSLVIADCLFQDNEVGTGGTTGVGGALSVTGPAEISGSVFFRNTAQAGSAIHCDAFGQSQLAITSCTLAQNSATSGSAVHLVGGARLTAHRSIIAFNGPGSAIHCEPQSTATLSCCDVFSNAGGDWIFCIAGQQNLAGNLALDPLFCDLANDVLTLREGSPCAPDNTGECGLIGALPVDCGAQAVIPTTWGRIKAAYLR